MFLRVGFWATTLTVSLRTDIIEEWLGTDLTQTLLVIVSTVAIFLAVILVVRLNGLRSFSKMSSFDFAVTVAVGSLIASVAMGSSSLLNGVIALVVIIGSQRLVAMARKHTHVEEIIDNKPLLLLANGQLIHDHLDQARVTPSDVMAKLREANALQPGQVHAVVLETTGDISVLHGDEELDPSVLEGVVGADLYST